MHHLLRNVDAGFARDEHDAAPFLAGQHRFEIMPRQAHRTHHVDSNIFVQSEILDIEEGFRLVESEIVDEDIDFGKSRHQRSAAFGTAEIERGGVQFGRRLGFA